MKILPLIALTLGTASIAASPLCAQTIQVNKENRTIAVTATDKVILQADIATVHIGFIAYGPDSDTAYASGSRLSNAIYQAVLATGIAKDAIESENQNVSPVQEYQIDKLTPEQKAQRQFQVSQSWTVRTGAADVSKILDVAVKAGANQSGQIDWSLKDQNAAEAEAAAKALQRARSVADQMARGLNTKLGELVYASNEVESEPIRPIIRKMPMGAAIQADQVAPLAINPRQIEKTATVQAIFAIE
ncbi:SIMPL domain-containing protein [Granulicella arctica]|uniref:DUF541 domain-containing protein n=1 Tax=Granulicella arctica TaxID=940613 RepID=A0A7Y9PFY3_9BACT|nr:SIMPL domain-containing protein [Granulicella arctica]NYF79193.1 hypothetical protein [Granulicella arctica]